MQARSSDSWFSLDLGDAVLATASCADIQQAFQPQFAAAGRPAGMAVFKRHDDDRGLHCAVTVYFAPAAAEIAAAFDATVCARPSRRGLELLAGDPACWAVLFPAT